MEQKSKFTECLYCNSDACVETDIGNNEKTWLCYTCGFQSSTLYGKDSETSKEIYSSLPELYKSLSNVIDDRYYFPTTINIPEKGMVFIDGVNKDEYCWVGVRATSVLEEEKEKYPIPNTEGEFYKYKTDIDTKKYFHPYKFMDALEYTNTLI